MKKKLVLYYSNKGSNRYLANKIAKSLSCEIEEIKPRLNVFLFFLLNINLGIKPLKKKVEEYEQIILCGPIWMGRFIPPLQSFVKQYQSKINQLFFATCCGSPDEKKDEKFGHGLVFKKVEGLLKEKCVMCRAFPIELVVPAEKKEDQDAIMKTRLNDENFKGEIQERLDDFVEKIKK